MAEYFRAIHPYMKGTLAVKETPRRSPTIADQAEVALAARLSPPFHLFFTDVLGMKALLATAAVALAYGQSLTAARIYGSTLGSIPPSTAPASSTCSWFARTGLRPGRSGRLEVCYSRSAGSTIDTLLIMARVVSPRGRGGARRVAIGRSHA